MKHINKSFFKLENFGIASLIVLVCLLIQSQTNFAQMSAPVDLGLLNGKAKTLAKPEYPETAKKNSVGGAVKVNVIVDEQGNVVKAEAVSGEMLLRDAALAAARATKFEPYLIKGKAVKFSGNLVFNFTNSSSSLNKSSDEFIKSAADKKAISDAMDDLMKEEMTYFNLINKYPDYDDYLNSTSYVKYDKGDYEGAVKDATEELKKNPSAQKYELRAKAYFQLKDYDNALKDINLAIEKSLEKSAALASRYAFRGDIYKAKYSYVMAEADYRKALELAPNDKTVKQKLSGLSGQKVGDTTAIQSFQSELKTTLEEFDRLKSNYEKKTAVFNELLETEKKKTGNVNVTGLCQSLLAIKSDWARLDPIINKTSDKISELQKQGKVDEYFAGATLQLAQTGEMLDWANDTYIPEKEKYVYLFDKLGCKAIEKP